FGRLVRLSARAPRGAGDFQAAELAFLPPGAFAAHARILRKTRRKDDYLREIRAYYPDLRAFCRRNREDALLALSSVRCDWSRRLGNFDDDPRQPSRRHSFRAPQLREIRAAGHLRVGAADDFSRCKSAVFEEGSPGSGRPNALIAACTTGSCFSSTSSPFSTPTA